MVIYILKKIVTCLFILFLLAQMSFCLAYFTPNTLLNHASLFEAYHLFFKQLLSGEFIFSPNKSLSFLHEFFATFELCLLALSVSILIGIPVGVFAGMGSRQSLNNIIQIFSLILYSCPIVLLVTMTVFFLPPNGVLFMHENMAFPEQGISLIDILTTTHPDKFTIFIAQLKTLMLPIAILSIQPCIITIQFVSQSVKKIMKQNYIKAAMIRETSLFKIVRRHLLPNSIPSTIPKLAYNSTTLLFLTMVMEILLDINGIGKWVMLAYYQHNYNIIAIAILTCGAFISLLVLLSEIFTVIIGPMLHKENYV